jgi:hypothetical protein
MPNEFDPYREALVLEEVTVWPDEYDGWEAGEKARLAALLHAQPQQAAQLEYVRIHSGFCRQITVTADDLARLGAAV